MQTPFFAIMLIFVSITIGCKPRRTESTNGLKISDTENFITFDEMRELFLNTTRVHDIFSDPLPQGQDNVARAKRKFHHLMRAPFVYRHPGANPEQLYPGYIKGAQWNILYGKNHRQISSMLRGDWNKLQYADPNRSDVQLPFSKWLRHFQHDEIMKRFDLEAEALAFPDFIVLNEVDWGIGRSGYDNVAWEIANMLGYSYAFATNYLEIDNFFSTAPSFQREFEELYEQLINSENPDHKSVAKLYRNWIKSLEVNKDAFKGLSGNVILSRFPIKSAKIINVPLQYQAKDWFAEEKQQLTMTEWLKRSFIKKTFLTERIAMVRYGMDNILVVELEVNGAPDNKITVVTFHPEIFAPPRAKATAD